jgi:hypothetical protein
VVSSAQKALPAGYKNYGNKGNQSITTTFFPVKPIFVVICGLQNCLSKASSMLFLFLNQPSRNTYTSRNTRSFRACSDNFPPVQSGWLNEIIAIPVG